MGDLIKHNYTKSNCSESWKDNNVVFQIINPEIKKITLNVAKQLVIDRKKAMGNNTPTAVFVKVNNALSVEKAANYYYENSDAYEGTKAIAMLIDNYTARLVGNLIFKLNKQSVPVSLFNKQSKALDWLKKF
ncbi:MAG: hypothetical protein MK066_11520 [Crocinitomicaceae bacterium]|nr:hypothetical protein [Crocinitomicaceae bacterium]